MPPTCLSTVLFPCVRGETSHASYLSLLVCFHMLGVRPAMPPTCLSTGLFPYVRGETSYASYLSLYWFVSMC